MTRWLAILLLLVAGALIYTVLTQKKAAPASAPPPISTTEPRAITPRGDLASDEKSTIELFKNVSPSVVHITSLARRRSRLHFNVFEIPQGTGSGFVWDNLGHIVTNYHVIQNANKVKVTMQDNSVYEAKIVGVARDKDLAVLRLTKLPPGLKGIPMGTSASLQVGQKVYAIGNPFGLDQTLTTGVISGVGREINSVTKRPIRDVIQTDAAINPGNSGGPLLDSAGRVIGVNTAIYSPSGAYAGIGFAVPVDTVNRIVPQLIKGGKIIRAGLGIHIGTDQLSNRYRLGGVLVIDVPPNSAAGRAGMIGTKSGAGGRWILGDVIVAVDGKPVKTQSDLFRVLESHKVGESVEVQVERNGKNRKLRVTLQALP
jgi:S1-C subfamily serine protease